MKPARKKRNSNLILIAVIVLLTAILIGLVSCGGPKLKQDDSTTPPETTDAAASTGQTDTAGTADTTDNTEATQPSTPAVDPVTMRTVTNVNVYVSPDSNAPTVATLAKDTQVDVIGKEQGWSAILISNQTYYVPSETLRELDQYLIVIDAGHQSKGNYEKEPVGPGSTEMKIKVAAGTTGVSTGIPEYKLTLAVSLKLRDILEARGYKVVMIRSHHEVNISNAERAEVANKLYADAFIRVHANGSENSSVNGIMTLCQTKDNPYNADIYEECKELATLVLDEMVSATGANKQFVWEVDTMSGINWCQVPVTIVEMGYMSNPEEDERMALDEYQQKLAEGIANGIDKYFE